MDMENKNLMWQEHKQILSQMLKDLTLTGLFTDVTFVFDDHSQINSHKTVLAASSPFLSELLQSVEDIENQVLVHLEGIKYEIFEILLEFMYFGNATFESNDQINDIISTAKSLQLQQVDGLLKINNANYQCNECNKTYSRKDKLNVHVKSIHNGVTFNCNKCGKKLSSKHHIRRHEHLVHDGVKFNCEKCEKNFGEKGKLKIHIKKIHDGIKFNCNQCEQKFSEKRHLNYHVNSAHLGIKFSCSLCEKKFKDKQNLKSHVLYVHAGVRFSCDKCEKKFSVKVYLQEHVKSVHEDIWLQCNMCKKKFSEKRNLKRHENSCNSVQFSKQKQIIKHY